MSQDVKLAKAKEKKGKKDQARKKGEANFTADKRIQSIVSLAFYIYNDRTCYIQYCKLLRSCGQSFFPCAEGTVTKHAGISLRSGRIIQLGSDSEVTLKFYGDSYIPFAK
jgi:hypothetical protein